MVILVVGLGLILVKIVAIQTSNPIVSSETQKQPPEVFYKKAVFTIKQLCWSLF